MFSAQDSVWMAQALRLAERGLYGTSPNPRVGCVLVLAGDVVGSGWHRCAGEPHAEVHALREAGEAARGATAYVTLEPCSHHGRTPPCAEALIEAGVARVVVAVQDPNPQVAGEGIALLRAAGIAVESGLMEAEARELNVGFFARMTRGMPWVRSKIAMSLDGRTALADDARLNVRGIDAPRQPLRVVLDSQLRIPLEARVLYDGGNTLIYTALHNERKTALLQDLGATVAVMPDGKGQVDLPAILRDLAQRGCNEVLVEAGSTLNGALLHAGLVDELLLYVAPQLGGDAARGMAQLGELTSLDQRVNLKWRDVRQVGEDLRILAKVEKG